jgi:hypothetical protein
MPPAPRLEMAFCGLDCNTCEEYCATQSLDLAALDLARAKWGHKSLADTLCDGCRGAGRITDSCAGCAIRTCATARGLATCAPCPDYACPTLERVLVRTPAAREALERLRGG